MRKLCHCGSIQPCEKHRRKASGKRSASYCNKWRVLSERLRAENPLCADCSANDRVEPATECHHIRTIEEAPHLRLTASNIVCLCTGCHKSRHIRMKNGHRQDDFTK